MGKQKNLHYRGTKGNIIYYELNGGFYMRSKPVAVKQTKATKACAGSFGMAVRMSKNLRIALAVMLPDAKDRSLMYRLNACIYKWLLSGPQKNKISFRPVTELDYFSFNESAALKERLRLSLHVQWTKQANAVIEIPSINPVKDIVASAHTVSVTMQLAAACCRLADGAVADEWNDTIEIPYDSNNIPAQEMILPFDLKPGCLAVVAVSLKYKMKSKGKIGFSDAPLWMPGGIISAVYRKS
jgi:hypothetical protein